MTDREEALEACLAMAMTTLLQHELYLEDVVNKHMPANAKGFISATRAVVKHVVDMATDLGVEPLDVGLPDLPQWSDNAER